MATLTVELPAVRVNEEKQKVTKGFQREAKVPGYRPGKVPAKIVETKFKAEIDEEVRRRLVSDGFREAVKQKDVKVLSLSEVDDVKFTPDSNFQFKATVILAPVIELPNYKGIAISVPSKEVVEADLTSAIEDLRDRSADFKPVEGRPLAMDDFAVIDFTGTIDGKPVAEVAEKAQRMLGAREDMWLKMESESFLPGFADQLVGLEKGAQKTINVTLKEDFPVSEIAGKEVVFAVTLKEIQERHLPELNDEWANKIVEGKNLEEVQALLKEEIARQKESAAAQAGRRQIMDHLLAIVQCELPATYVRSEARRIMEDVVRENSQRGVAEEELRNNEEQIVENSMEAARNRVKLSFILVKIAEAEGIKASHEEIANRVASMAARMQMPMEKLIKQIKANDAFGRIEEEIVIGKVLDFLEANASVAEAA